jgi:RNA polymerase primary sigma factor
MKDTLESFFQQVGKTDLLTRDQEIELSKLIESGDKRARDKMIKANLRLAISIAKQYQNKGCDMEDLIQESSIGLIKAIDRFDWRRGFKFSTYACWWIKQSVRRHIASHSASFKLPAYAKNMMFKIQQAAAEYEEEFGQRPTQQEIADLLGVSTDMISSMIDCAMPTVSIDKAIGADGSGNTKTLRDVLPDDSDPVDVVMDKQKIVGVLRHALSTLTPREERIVRLRFGIAEDDNDTDNFPITETEYNALLVEKAAKEKR